MKLERFQQDVGLREPHHGLYVSVRPRGDVGRIDQAPELRQVASPPLVHAGDSGKIDGGEGSRLVTPEQTRLCLEPEKPS